MQFVKPFAFSSRQLIKKKSPVKRFWWDAVQGMYWDMYQEKLPHDWITVVQSKKNTGLEFNNPCTDLWTIALTQKVECFLLFFSLFKFFCNNLL